MEKRYLTFLMLIFGLLAHAQNISVADFYYAENDLTARTHGTLVEDQNGNLCALIKVRTTERGLWTFDVGMLGVTKTEMQNESHAAEIWVYVPFGVTRITIQHERLGLLEKWKFPCDIAKGCTYVMELDTDAPVPPPQDSQQQYLAFQISPANATLEVNDEIWSLDVSGTAMKYVDFGTYTYRVKAEGYHSDVGKTTVEASDKPIIVPITLTPISTVVTLNDEPDAKKRIISNEEEVFTVNGVRFTMKLVEGGTFQMGSNDKGKAYKDQKPVHDVTLNNYYMGETEVTQALWKAVMGSNPSNREGDYWPVENVSWSDCQEFIRKLNQLTNTDWNFRLPTEAEWEYAARGGRKSTGKMYAGSEYIQDVAWHGYSHMDPMTGSMKLITCSVKGKAPNELGLYDMSGNVWEWCQDWYGNYGSDSETNPTGPLDGTRRVMRGGSCYSYRKECRVSSRWSDDPGKKYADVGFRLCLSQ